MRFFPRIVSITAILAGVLTVDGSAQAFFSSLTVSKCLSGKVKTEGKAAGSYTGCHSNHAQKPDAVKLSACSGKTSAKLLAAFGKLDDKNDACPTLGDAANRDNDTAAFAIDNASLVGGPTSRCNGAKQKLVGKYVAAIAGCYAKAASKGGAVSTGSGSCTDKALLKLASAIGKVETKGPDCTHIGQSAALVNAADAYLDAQVCALDPTNPQCVGCGNGVLDPGEDCDLSAAVTCGAGANTGPAFACASCRCACPTRLTFTADGADPATVLDLGWTGLGHASPLVSNGGFTVSVSGCTGSSRPCGTCTVNGPIANPQAGAGELNSRRCTNNSATTCTSNAQCGQQCTGGTNDGNACTVNTDCPNGGGCPAAGTCEFFFAAPQALVAGGIGVCLVNQLVTPITGTASIESGEWSGSITLASRIFLGGLPDSVCPRCSDPGGINDSVKGGTCDTGGRFGLTCDANGAVANRPDFGQTSLDCPPSEGIFLGASALGGLTATDPVTKTVTASSPSCSSAGFSGEKCLCDTCNNANAQVCEVNADCPISGGNPGVCGGRRCLGGSNAGAPCGVGSACPGGLCGRPGEATKPGACADDPATPGVFDCVDTMPIDGEGACLEGPFDEKCSVASGHGQRTCLADSDCGGGAGSCESAPRPCFLTGSAAGFGEAGTQTLIAAGMQDAPINDVSAPTLGAVFCVRHLPSNLVNILLGIPGPGRLQLKGTAELLP